MVRNFSGFVTAQNKNGFFVTRIFLGCDLSEQKTGRFVARNILRTHDLATTTRGSSVPGFGNVRFVEVLVETVAGILFGVALQFTSVAAGCVFETDVAF